MGIHLYEASVPVFLRYLDRLRCLIDKADAHVHDRAVDPAVLLGARLAPDMLSLDVQVAIAASFGLRACYPLAGHPVPPYGEFAGTFAGMRQRLDYVVGLLCVLEPAQFDGAHARVIESLAGNATVVLRAPEFLLHYALPNFFFHLSTVYALLRSQGVDLGKADFDGFHAYPHR
jgi:hypothetical protein